jgi:hypothetical protein
MSSFYRNRIPGSGVIPQVPNTYYQKGSDFAPHNMTSDIAPLPYVAIFSTEYSALRAFAAFDGLLYATKYWVTNGVSTGYIGLDIGTGSLRRLYSYKLVMNTIPEPNRAPKNWTFEGSTTGVWGAEKVILDTQTNQTSWGSGEGREFTNKLPGGLYRFFRMNCTLNNGDAYLQMGEMYLYEAIAIGN